MAIPSEQYQLDKAFFHSVGKINTKKGQYVFESAFKSGHIVTQSEIRTDNIPFAGNSEQAQTNVSENPTVLKFYDKVELKEVEGTNGEAYYITDPDTQNTITGLVGPTDAMQGTTPSNGYLATLHKSNGEDIPATTGVYVIDYFSGLVLFGNGYTPANLGWGTPKLSFYAYIGRKLNVDELAAEAGTPDDKTIKKEEGKLSVKISQTEHNALVVDGTGLFVGAIDPESLPVATSAVLGAIKKGEGLAIDGSGVASIDVDGSSIGLTGDAGSKKVSVKISGNAGNTIIVDDQGLFASNPVATNDVAGVVKVGADDEQINLALDGTISLKEEFLNKITAAYVNASYENGTHTLTLSKNDGSSTQVVLPNSVTDISYAAKSEDENVMELKFTFGDGSAKSIEMDKEKFLSSASYDQATNILTLSMTNGDEVTVDLTDLIDPVIFENSTTVEFETIEAGEDDKGGKFRATVKLSATGGNKIKDNNGLYVAPYTAATSETATVTVDQEANTIKVDAKISADEGNILGQGSVDKGLFVAPYTVADTNSVDMTLTGKEIKADVKLSVEEGNIVEIKADGIYVPTPDEFNLSAATSTTLGGVKVSDNDGITVDPDGTIKANVDGTTVEVNAGTKKIGLTQTIQTSINEKLKNITYSDYKLTLTKGDDSTSEVDLTNLHDVYTGVDGNTATVTVSGEKAISVDVKISSDEENALKVGTDNALYVDPIKVDGTTITQDGETKVISVGEIDVAKVTGLSDRLSTIEGDINNLETSVGQSTDPSSSDSLFGKVKKNAEDISTINGKLGTEEDTIEDNTIYGSINDLKDKVQNNSLDVQNNGTSVDASNPIHLMNFEGEGFVVTKTANGEVKITMPFNLSKMNASNFNSTGGTTSPTVANVSQGNSRYVALPGEGASYKVGDWATTSTHSVLLNSTSQLVYKTADACWFKTNDSVFEIIIYGADGVEELKKYTTNAITGNGTYGTLGSDFISVGISGWTEDFMGNKAVVTITINYKNIVTDGGRFSVKITQKQGESVVGTAKTQNNFFYDKNDTTPAIESVTGTITTPVTKFVSGVEYYTTNTKVTVTTGNITNALNQTFPTALLKTSCSNNFIGGVGDVNWGETATSGITGYAADAKSDAVLTYSKEFTINNNLYLTSNPTVSVAVYDWSLGSAVSGTVTLDKPINTKNTASTDLIEYFEVENKRRHNTGSYDLFSEEDYKTLDADGLQVGLNGKVGYPAENSDSTGFYRTFVRSFNKSGVANGNGKFTFSGGSSFTETDLANGNIKMEISLDGTNWFDLSKSLVGSATANGDGCRVFADTDQLPNAISFSFGGGNTNASTGGGWGIFYRLSVKKGSNAQVDTITLGW